MRKDQSWRRREFSCGLHHDAACDAPGCGVVGCRMCVGAERLAWAGAQRLLRIELELTNPFRFEMLHSKIVRNVFRVS